MPLKGIEDADENMCVNTSPLRELVRAPERDLVIQRVLRAAREHLDLDVAFVSQLIDGQRVFRYVDAEDRSAFIEVGGSDPVEESYCHYVIEGSLPEFVSDAAKHPVSASVAATQAFGIGTHLSVPIRLSDGRVYGTLCCFAQHVQPTVTASDVSSLRMLAQLVSEYVEALDREERDQRLRHERIASLVHDPTGLTMVFQPLVELTSGRLVEVEALARFPTQEEGPEAVFAEAWRVGLGIPLEMRAVRAALAALDELPTEVRLGVNVSPATLISRQFHEATRSIPADRLTVEVTEHSAVDDYDALRRARRDLHTLGIRLAIDDVGTGFAGLHHILESAPDSIKIDAAVVRNLDTDPTKQAMIEALVTFGQRVGISVIAEGIETRAEMRALQSLGVPIGQGYHLARPNQLRYLQHVLPAPRLATSPRS